MIEITIFTAPKPFTDPHINIIQRNAIQSWKSLGSQVEVLLVGDEDGMAEAASDLGVIQLPDVAKNDLGTPLVNSIFSAARQASQTELYIYTNADIIFTAEILSIIASIRKIKKEFLLVGQRWDLDVEKRIDFSGPWQSELRRQVAESGYLKSQTAMDYFIFTKGLYQEIPPFAIGRAGWDNWMIFQALQEKWPVIDITPDYQVIHQNHDYRHLPGGKIHYDLEESHQNVMLGGGIQKTYDLLDVNRIFDRNRIRIRPLSIRKILRLLERRIIPEQQEGLRWRLTVILRKTRKRIEYLRGAR